MTEAEAKDGLALMHYPGKWNQAMRLAVEIGANSGLPYWARVRNLYLELGGVYIAQLNCSQQYRYHARESAVSV